MQRARRQGKPTEPKAFQLAIGLLVVAFVPYALFGARPKIAKGLALFNGALISLVLIFGEPWLLLPNPFLALFASTSIWTKRNHVGRKS